MMLIVASSIQMIFPIRRAVLRSIYNIILNWSSLSRLKYDVQFIILSKDWRRFLL